MRRGRQDGTQRRQAPARRLPRGCHVGTARTHERLAGTHRRVRGAGDGGEGRREGALGEGRDGAIRPSPVGRVGQIRRCALETS